MRALSPVANVATRKVYHPHPHPNHPLSCVTVHIPLPPPPPPTSPSPHNPFMHSLSLSDASCVFLATRRLQPPLLLFLEGWNPLVVAGDGGKKGGGEREENFCPVLFETTSRDFIPQEHEPTKPPPFSFLSHHPPPLSPPNTPPMTDSPRKTSHKARNPVRYFDGTVRMQNRRELSETWSGNHKIGCFKKSEASLPIPSPPPPYLHNMQKEPRSECGDGLVRPNTHSSHTPPLPSLTHAKTPSPSPS